MFFYLSKIVTFLIDPLFAILLLLLIFLVKGSRRFKSRLILLSIFLFLYLASTGFIANTLLVQLEGLVQPTPLAKHYNAVVVLSGMTRLQNSSDNSVEFSGAVDRILAGIRLVRDGQADFLVISGGDGSLTQRNRPEAEILRAFANRWGINDKQILTDSTSRNTFENALRTSELVKQNNLGKLLLITSAFHMFRSRGCFKRAGLEVDVLPVDYRGDKSVADFRGFLPSSASLAMTNQVIHEVVGIIAYRVAGRADYSLMP